MATTNFAGLASGIDTTALIDATSAATRAQKVTPKQTQISNLTATDDAFTELKTRLNTVKTLAEGFGTINGGAVAKAASSSNESVATAVASNGATNGTYDIAVTSLAKAASYSYNYNYTSGSDTFFGAGESGTFSMQIGNVTPETVNVTVTADMKVGEFVTAFNAASTRAQASVVQVASGQYRLLISTKNSGTDAGAVVSSTVSANSRISTTIGTGSNQVTTDPATNATFTMNGIGPFTRQNNTVSDIVTGLSFQLLSSPGSVKISVGDDADASVAIIKKFIDAYNDVITYVTENDTVTRDESGDEVKNVFAPFASTRTDNSAIAMVRDAFSGLHYPDTIPAGLENQYPVRILADIGIETQEDGTLVFNDTTSSSGFSSFRNALALDPDAVSALTQKLGDKLGFTYNAATGNGVIDSITGFNRLIDTTVTGNTTLISSLTDQISEAEKQITQTESDLKARYARLESLMSSLQSQQSTLTSALAGLS